MYRCCVVIDDDEICSELHATRLIARQNALKAAAIALTHHPEHWKYAKITIPAPGKDPTVTLLAFLELHANVDRLRDVEGLDVSLRTGSGRLVGKYTSALIPLPRSRVLPTFYCDLFFGRS